ncbi:TPM domain-containing protein [Desulfobulbus sp. US2]|nr:TPM domain-containing protein [Desulfobulbus sp. US2]
MKIIGWVLFCSVFLAMIFYKSDQNTEKHTVTGRHVVTGHVFDKAGIISASDVPRFENHLDLIEKESDLDIKFLFLKTIRPSTIEEVAVEKMSEYRIGGNGREERGVLFLYVMDEKNSGLRSGMVLRHTFLMRLSAI